MGFHFPVVLKMLSEIKLFSFSGFWIVVIVWLSRCVSEICRQNKFVCVVVLKFTVPSVLNPFSVSPLQAFINWVVHISHYTPFSSQCFLIFVFEKLMTYTKCEIIQSTGSFINLDVTRSSRSLSEWTNTKCCVSM